LALLKKGLAYQKKALVNWDPIDNTVLANEQVDLNGRSWRSGALVEKRQRTQWFLRITSYSKELLNGLDALDWPKNVKIIQSKWIGKTEWIEMDFEIYSKENESLLNRNISVSVNPFLSTIYNAVIVVPHDHWILSSE